MLTIDDLRQMATELLGPGTTPPGDHDDLIAFGLDSIRFMQIANRCRRAGLTIGFGDLARTPTLAEWSRLIAPSPDPEPELEPASVLVDASGPFPLASMQHAYWVGRGGSADLGAVAAHLYTEFDGHGVDPVRLGAAVAALADRHPMLRARITDDGRQVIEEWSRGEEPEVLDLREATPQEAERRLAELRDRLSHQLLDVAAGRMFDIRVTLLPGGGTRVHVDVDMLAADARSYRVLLSDLVALYRDPAARLPEIGCTFAGYQAARGAQRPAERDVTWWRERVPNLPGAPALPLRADSAEPDRVTRLHHWLSPAERDRLTTLARARGLTPAVAVATVFAEVVGAWSGEPRFLLNVPLFDRRPLHPDVDNLVGDFTSSIMLEVDLTERRTFAQRAAQVQERMHEAAAHSSYPGLDVLRDLAREQGAPVLAPVVFTSALDLGELFGPEVESCLGEAVWIVSQGPQVLLDAQITEFHGGLLANWDIRAGAFPDSLPEDMFAAFRTLLARIGDPEAWDEPVGPLLPAAALKVRAEANDTDGPLPALPLHRLFFDQAARTPQAPALLGPGGPVAYGELAEQALRVAGALRAHGVRDGDPVAIRLPKGPEQVVAVLGVLAAGGHYVPIGVEQPQARAERITTRAGVGVVLGQNLPYQDAVSWPEPLAEPVATAPEAIAYVLFTSGSTGEPKGVEVSHLAAANTVADLADRFALGPADRTLALSALDFDLSVFDVFAPLSTGGAVVTVEEEARRDAASWAREVRTHQVSVLNCVPSLLDMLLTAAERDPLGPTLRAVLLGGDRVGVDLPARLVAQVPGCRFAGLGGTTETAIHSTFQEVTAGRVPAGWTGVPYGTPLRNVRCRVVDAQGRDCPDWVPGELWIGGAGVADGYRGDPERTADRFVPLDGVRWYRTGDRARYWQDGTIEFLGRADHQVKIRGFRIELGEVEAALGAHPAVRQATALVLGTGAPRLHAVVAAAGGLTEEEITAHAAERLPAHMIPDRVVVVDALPLTGNGKVDRRALTALVTAQAQAPGQAEPVTALEQVIALIWARALGLEKVGRDDDYFLLGGDSVLATVIVGRLRDVLDTDAVSVHDVLRHPTVARLAAQVRDDRTAQVAEIYLEIEAMTDDELNGEFDGESGVGEPEAPRR
ncbi:amino acid adenylation domain-containing protein [Streptosporangium sp. NBC_01755]|uniref:amino acid adenylation domain-containing protein n=1 Tax=unclassified Streptosporangium TaxID=2632669 RepID=UPI002DDC7461|nr:MULTISPECIES: amino acid adenylation domain-containing protein [unclassified Streptosporangium]WSA28077.1 amino acid adenylation domain-containing protein [Streptosporangium sp. NBC_01810]WSD00450.1 amino acid adenylation domain-containing protein [Streptosporangium sp. NBC_01755]